MQWVGDWQLCDQSIGVGREGFCTLWRWQNLPVFTISAATFWQIQLDIHYHSGLAYFIVSMHACHNLWLSSQDTVFQLWYNLSCSQWLEWCLGIFIVIANVSLSSFQPTTPPDKLFKDKSSKTHFCLFIVSLQKRYFWVVYLFIYFLLFSFTDWSAFWTPC